MPLIFAENERTESGISYTDKTGILYQYPKHYRKLIQPGERFIYYRGRKTAGSARTPQIYFGRGIVGETREDIAHPGRFICDIFDYRPFETPVPFKFDKDDYLESGGNRRGYFQPGVRKVSESDFQRILDLADSSIKSFSEKPLWSEKPSRIAYASPETARIVDDYAMSAAESYLSKNFPGHNIEAMSRNNPGFDILVSKNDDPLFVEVKGTQRPAPQFFLTDGERRFSKDMAERYLLLVFYRINLSEKSHDLLSRRGEIDGPSFDLSPLQWSVTARM